MYILEIGSLGTSLSKASRIRAILNTVVASKLKSQISKTRAETLAAISTTVVDVSQNPCRRSYTNDNNMNHCLCTSSIPIHLGQKRVVLPVEMGRTLDLSRACKQLGIDRKSRRLSVVGYQHEGEWKYYLNHVLPFGVTASVYSFNRVSKSLHHIICKLLFSLSTCFYDDFPTVSLRPRSSRKVCQQS